MKKLILFVFLTTLINPFNAHYVFSQEQHTDKAYVKNGIFYLPNGEELRHFGVNYSPAFAFEYRAIDKLGLDHKKAIDMDFDHIERLNLDAYRLHVWEKEISDSQGNIVENIHLDLLDYMLAELAKKDIKIILTAISWWGNGYPQPDLPSDAFSAGLSKNDMNEDKSAIKATKNYLKQFVNRKNKYSGIRYKDDPNIIAFELFNEPRHAGSASKAKSYVNELVDAVREEGVEQPLFYNISEQGLNKAFAEGICTSKIDGIAYQWYPTGLVKNAELHANTLLSVSKYTDPFREIPACKSRAKIIYEFDAADTNLNSMYPAMARSFRAAGFQWATQFAYDPAVLANSNAAYNTHYMNMLYTPSKAIGLLIASEVFRQLPQYTENGIYPLNNQFNGITLKPEDNLSILNQSKKFYYTNNNDVTPADDEKIESIAGVKSSQLVKYTGSGAYFLDRISPETWMLEVYPDVLHVQDPFQSPSLNREVRRLYKSIQTMTIDLPNLRKDFYIFSLTSSTSSTFKQAINGSVDISPDKYLISNGIENIKKSLDTVDKTYLLPPIKSPELALVHSSQRQRNLGEQVSFITQVAGQNRASTVSLVIRYVGDKEFKIILMEPKTNNEYFVSLPRTDEWNRVGTLEYGFVVSEPSEKFTFPGNVMGSPTEWDFVSKHPFWEMALRPSETPISLFDHDKDRNTLVYPNSGRGGWQTVAGEYGLEFALRLQMDSLLKKDGNFVVRATLSPENSLRKRKLDGYKNIVINIKAVEKPTIIGFDLIDRHGFAYGTEVLVQPEWQNIVIPISALRPRDSSTTQAYPSFMPDYFINTNESKSINQTELELLQGFQVRFPSAKLRHDQRANWQAVDLANVYLLM
jgi:hypothetical protein